MFQRLASIALAFTALVLSAGAAAAQAPDWDRRIGDIHIVHPPGTPPGFARVSIDLALMSGPLAPVPTNLGVDVLVSLNGMPFLTRTLSAEAVQSEIACFPTTGCPEDNCNVWFLASNGLIVNNNAYCSGVYESLWGCRCWSSWNSPWTFDMVVQPGDVIDVVITPSAGSLPEIDTSDDTFSARVGDYLPGVDFCFGDGSGVACPCGNSGAPGNGCASSVNAQGAYLGATGTASVAADGVVLTGSGMSNSTCLYFQGTTQLAGALFGDGLRCAGGAVIRLGTKANSAGSSAYPAVGDLPISVKGAVPMSGGSRTYQAWYRNAAAFCTTSTFNLTNGVSIAWNP